MRQSQIGVVFEGIFSPHSISQYTELFMAFDYCHPTAPHKKLRLPNWYVSSLMMDRALDAVARKVRNLDRKHDIPYLAG